MPNSEFEELLSVNDQIASMAELGVRFDLGLGNSARQVSLELQEINALLARKLSQGCSLDDALGQLQQGKYQQYASTMRYALATNDWNKALDRSRTLVEASEQAWHSVWSGLAYPLLICVLAYLGLVGFSLYLAPSLQATFVDLRLPPSMAVRWMTWLSEHLAAWAWIPPIVLVAIAGWCRWKGWTSQASGRQFKWQRQAKLANVLGDLETSQCAAEQREPIAKAACSDANHPPDEGSSKQMPPLVRWTTSLASSSTVRGELLHGIAEAYDCLGTIKAFQISRRAILIPFVLIGGGAALLYGLALFVPMVELLTAFAESSTTRPFTP
ncbi:type II secretion system F family protein [Aeoliella mucimassa]|uniref:Type IV pilin biogenesis protein n=1 Tax=Aeoliella mucimassa TaxID=2527972 RepID=A0A518ANC5_9BACT|nr:type II secretion system F family protein [Aeoliella mucimassa]QDU56213.1 type IV pilin biogenesis protein [Aeoliella mucimassa]